MQHEVTYEMEDVARLAVRADLVLGVTPEVIHRVQVGAAEWRPEQLDAEAIGLAARGLGRVTRVFIQQQHDVLARVVGPDPLQIRSELDAPLPRAVPEQAVPGTRVERAPDDARGVPAGQRDVGLAA